MPNIIHIKVVCILICVEIMRTIFLAVYNCLRYMDDDMVDIRQIVQFPCELDTLHVCANFDVLQNI